MTEPTGPTPPTRLDATGPPPTRLDATGPPATRLDVPHRTPEVNGASEFRRENLPPGLAARLTMRTELGAGTEASVWLCVDAAGNEFAVKLFRHPPHYGTDFGSAEYRDHFRPEYAVQVYERAVDHGVHYEIMEYCRHGTLDDLLGAHGGFGTNKFAVEILWQLATALHGMQRADTGRVLVHGDVKPKNILVRTAVPLDLVLTDFGLTVDLGDRSKLTNLGAGTIAYSAPGALQYLSPEADWWSLGLVMFRVLVGRGYFQRDDGSWIDDRTIERELNIRDVSLTALDDVALRTEHRDRWKLLLAGLLTRDPQVRWGMAQVAQWYEGASPAVHRSPVDTGPRASIPHALPGVGQFFQAGELGAAMARHPDAAARSLSGRGLQTLLAWLTDEVRTPLSLTDLKSHGGAWGPDELATYFIAQLAPDATPAYRGRPIATRAELCALALDESAVATVGELFDRDLLGCLAGPTRPDHKMIDADWRDIVEQTLMAAQCRQLPVPAAARAEIVRYALLVSAGDERIIEEFLAQVRDRLDGQELRLAGEVAWFTELRREAGI